MVSHRYRRNNVRGPRGPAKKWGLALVPTKTVDLTCDRALLDGFRRGDRGALERVYRAHVDDVMAVFRRGFVSGEARVAGVRSVDLCMELTQEVFTKAFAARARQSYDGLRPYRPFLERIAKNLQIDRLRVIKREVPEANPEDRLGTTDAPSPEAELHDKRLSEAIRAFITTQDEELQIFVDLRFVQECSQYEVLAEMKTTRRRVRTLEKRALQGLRSFLQSKGLP